jgi:hypothetical protein
MRRAPGLRELPADNERLIDRRRSEAVCAREGCPDTHGESPAPARYHDGRSSIDRSRHGSRPTHTVQMPPIQRATSGVSLTLGLALGATTAYLVVLLFGHAFGVGRVLRHHIESASYLFAAAAAIAAFRRTFESRTDTPDATRRGWLVPTAGFVAASWVLYGNTISLGLFSDDYVLADRALAGHWTGDGEFVRPLPAVLWAAVLRVTRSATGLHALNIGLHGLNAALVYLLARRFKVSPAAAVGAGLLFLTFPGSVEAVVCQQRSMTSWQPPARSGSCSFPGTAVPQDGSSLQRRFW